MQEKPGSNLLFINYSPKILTLGLLAVECPHSYIRRLRYSACYKIYPKVAFIEVRRLRNDRKAADQQLMQSQL